jgi:large subunit ribosomal protein L24e
MSVCSFCGEKMEKGSGKIFVKSDGSILYFCSGKCEKNSNIRDRKKIKWTSEYQKLKKRRVKTLTKAEKK